MMKKKKWKILLAVGGIVWLTLQFMIGIDTKGIDFGYENTEALAAEEGSVEDDCVEANGYCLPFGKDIIFGMTLKD